METVFNNLKQIYQTTQIFQCTVANNGTVDINIRTPFEVKAWEVQMNITNVDYTAMAPPLTGNSLYGVRAPTLTEQDVLCSCVDGNNFNPLHKFTNTAKRTYNGTYRVSVVNFTNGGVALNGNQIVSLIFTFYG